jgi:hypothetical protein
VPFGHHHKQQEEVYILIAGTARVKLDDEIVEPKQLDAVRIPRRRCATSRLAPTGPRPDLQRDRIYAPHAREVPGLLEPIKRSGSL